MPQVQAIVAKTSNRLKALVGPSTYPTYARTAHNAFTPVSSVEEHLPGGIKAHWKHSDESCASSCHGRNDSVESVLDSVSHLSIDTRDSLFCSLSADSPIDLSFIGTDDEVEEEIMGICEASKGLMSSPLSATLSLPRYPIVSGTPLYTSLSEPPSSMPHPFVDEWADSDDEGGDADEGQAGADGDSLGSETIFGYFPLLGQKTQLSRSPSFKSGLNGLSGLASSHGTPPAPPGVSATNTRAPLAPVDTQQKLHPKSRSVYGATQKLSHSPTLRDPPVNPALVDAEDNTLHDWDWDIVRDSPRLHLFRPVAKQALKPASGQYVFPTF